MQYALNLCLNKPLSELNASNSSHMGRIIHYCQLSGLLFSWTSLMDSTGLSSYHGILPNLTRRWIRRLVDGSLKAPGGSMNQQYTTALLSFLYHLACYEEHVHPGTTQNVTLSTSGVLDTMLQLISWHTARNDCLSYVTRAVRVTDQILMSISSSRQQVVGILVDRLKYEVDLVLRNQTPSKVCSLGSPRSRHFSMP